MTCVGLYAVNVLTGVDSTELDPAVLGDYVLGLLTESRRVAAVQVGIADRCRDAHPS